SGKLSNAPQPAASLAPTGAWTATLRDQGYYLAVVAAAAFWPTTHSKRILTSSPVLNKPSPMVSGLTEKSDILTGVLPAIFTFLSARTVTVTGIEILLVTPATASWPTESNR